MSPAKLARIARRELWQRRLPHGLLGWRYFWPNGDEHICRHRQLWWRNGAGWTRPLWLVVQAWLWLRWIFWFAWRATWRTVRRLGPELVARDGLPLRRQAWRVLRLALRWCIPPGDCYRCDLLSHPERALDFVYDQELPAFHLWRSAALDPSRADTSAAHTRLQDKPALAAELTLLGIPMVPTRVIVPLAEPPRPLAEHLVEHLTKHPIDLLPAPPRLFCKTRSGNQGRGAFMLWQTAEGLAGRGFDGQALSDTAAVEAAWQRLRALDDVLIQPCLTNHPQLAALAGSGAPDDDSRADAITVRYISQWRAGAVVALSAVLEVPAGRDARTQRPTYSLLPIDPATGQVLPWPRPQSLPASVRAAQARLWARIGAQRRFPDWPALVAASHQAQGSSPASGPPPGIGC